MSNEQAPICCGQSAKWVELTHSSQYWYCTSCKKEVKADIDYDRSHDYSTITPGNTRQHRTRQQVPSNLGGSSYQRVGSHILWVPQPAEPRFKVGDRVQLIGCINPLTSREIIAVDQATWEYEASGYLGQGSNRMSISDVELYYELDYPVLTGLTKFKTGDKIYNPHNITGDVSLVVHVDLRSKLYYTSDGNWFYASHIPMLDGRYELWTSNAKP